MTGRAKAGGEIGVNGDHYYGGQYLPSSPYTVKGAHGTSGRSSHKRRKVEVAPYTYEVAPDGMVAIYGQISGTLARLNDNGEMEFCAKAQTLAYFRTTEEQAREMIERWNQGERWTAKK